jgi:hypothetical protein
MSTEDKSSKIKEALRQGFLDGTSNWQTVSAMDMTALLTVLS